MSAEGRFLKGTIKIHSNRIRKESKEHDMIIGKKRKQIHAAF